MTRKPSTCDFCGVAIESARVPRVRVTDHFDGYAGGERKKVYHRQCWEIVEAAVPLIRALAKIWPRENGR
jgi:hypothetical protein